MEEFFRHNFPAAGAALGETKRQTHHSCGSWEASDVLKINAIECICLKGPSAISVRVSKLSSPSLGRTLCANCPDFETGELPIIAIDTLNVHGKKRTKEIFHLGLARVERQCTHRQRFR